MFFKVSSVVYYYYISYFLIKPKPYLSMAHPPVLPRTDFSVANMKEVSWLVREACTYGEN